MQWMVSSEGLSTLETEENLMAKTPICWTIHNDWMGTRILAVTSIQPYGVFGRRIRG